MLDVINQAHKHCLSTAVAGYLHYLLKSSIGHCSDASEVQSANVALQAVLCMQQGQPVADGRPVAAHEMWLFDLGKRSVTTNVGSMHGTCQLCRAAPCDLAFKECGPAHVCSNMS